MARTKRSRRSYGAGEWGRNRVRVFPDPKTGLYQMEWRENGRRLTRSLRHRDWMRAKREADEFAASFVGPDLNGKADAEPEPLTLGTLFDIYGEEVTTTKAERVQRRDRVATGMFLDFLGRDRRPETLSQRDWDRFIRERRAGTVGPSGKPVGDRTVEWDLTFLMAVLNWAARSKDEQGRPLLDRNPLKGLKKPREKNPTRVVLTEEEYQALLGVSRQVGWRFHVALVPRARDRAPDRRDSQAAVVRHRPRRRDGEVAGAAREDGLRTRHAADRRCNCGVGRCVEDERRKRKRSDAARAGSPLAVPRSRPRAEMVA